MTRDFLSTLPHLKGLVRGGSLQTSTTLSLYHDFWHGRESERSNRNTRVPRGWPSSTSLGGNYWQLEIRGIPTVVIDRLLGHNDARVDSELAPVIQVPVKVWEVTT
jgi:hypothetical protein